MELKKIHWIGIGFGLAITIVGLIFFSHEKDQNLLLFLLGIALTIVALPFVIQVIIENKREQQVSEMFLEFSRNLAESVNTGTPISKSIINMRNKNYGALTPYVQKLANQISIGIPVNQAFQTFAFDVNNPVITRAVTLIREAEKAGGEIDYILESAAKSIAEVEKLRKERKAAIYSLVVQGYIIFFIFIGIMLVMEFKILPLTSGISQFGGLSGDFSAVARGESAATAVSVEELSNPFLFLLLAQGFFAGLTIGKLAEGTIRAGIKHSFIMTVTAFLVSTGVRLVFN